MIKNTLLLCLRASSFLFVLALSSQLIAADNNQPTRLDFEIIPIHHDLLNDKPAYTDELEGLVNINVKYDVSLGETLITFTTKPRFKAQELIAYQTAGGKYAVAQVANQSGHSITLTRPLKNGIAKGRHVWNFYADGSHPNVAGFKALADFALNQSEKSDLENKTHAFIGDSWFNEGSFEKRIIHEINVLNSINKSVGGRTSADTLNAFDEDFPTHSIKPDIFWLSVGTNDFWEEMTPQVYIANIEAIIRKVNEMGAKAIVLEAAVGPYGYDDIKNETTFVQKDLSEAYVQALHQLYEKNQPVVVTPVTPTNPTPTVPTNPTPTTPSTSGGGPFPFSLFILFGLLARYRIMRTA